MARRRNGFTVIEVLIGVTLGLMLWAIVMTMMRAEARMREDVDGRVNADAVPAALYRHLSRDLSRTPRVEGGAVKVSADGRTLELSVQVAPARIEGRRVDLPVVPVRYRMESATTVVREQSGRREVLPVEGLKDLQFAREAAREAGAQDLLRVTGAVDAGGVMGTSRFALAFPVGARKAGAVRWVWAIARPR